MSTEEKKPTPLVLSWHHASEPDLITVYAWYDTNTRPSWEKFFDPQSLTTLVHLIGTEGGGGAGGGNPSPVVHVATTLMDLDPLGTRKELYISYLGVRPDRRRMGFGAVALAKAFEGVAALPSVTVQCRLHVDPHNVRAMSLYERSGFVVRRKIHRYYNKEHMGVEMIKKK